MLDERIPFDGAFFLCKFILSDDIDFQVLELLN